MVAPLDPGTVQTYTDVEALLVGWLSTAMADYGVTVATERPLGDLLLARLPFIHVECFGGADLSVAVDRPHVDVDCYVAADAEGNPDRAGAADLGEAVRAALLLHLPGYDNGTGTVLNVATITRPTARPYDDNTAVRRSSAAYQITVKSHS